MQNGEKVKMLVSVVIIAYNSADTIIETLDSVYYQSYDNLELIVADDCSKDDTSSIVNNWFKEKGGRFNSTLYISNDKNVGVTKNGNIGIKAARGSYVQLIAGDDKLCHNCIKAKIDYIQDRKVDYIVCKTKLFGKNDETIREMQKFCDKGYDVLRKTRDEQLSALLKNNIIVGPSGSFFRKEFFDEFGGFDERYPMMEDYPFIFHYLMSGRTINFIDEELTEYRVSDNSLSISANSAMWISLRLFYEAELRGEIIKRKKFGLLLYHELRYKYKALKTYFRKKG